MTGGADHRAAELRRLAGAVAQLRRAARRGDRVPASRRAQLARWATDAVARWPEDRTAAKRAAELLAELDALHDGQIELLE